MNLLYKECEVCGTKINKLQSWLNIYTLKAGKTLICSKCNTEYKTSKLIGFIGSFYTYSGISIFILLFCTSYLWDFIEQFFKIKIGGEIWIYTFILLSMVELLLMVLLPLKKIESKE